MTELKLTRNWKKDAYTVGRFFVDGKYWCNTLEDKDRDLYSAMPISKIKAKKVYGETAIPRGQYHIELSYSAKFASRVWGKKYNGLVPEIKNVPGFTAIRVHPLNTATDSLGCIGIGENRKKGRIENSTKWYYKLMDEILLPAYNNGEIVTIDIQ